MAAPFARTTRALERDHGRAALWLWGLALAVGLAWAAWFVLARVTVVEVSRRARLEVQQAAHTVSAPQAGRVAQHHLELGREVQAGELLVQLDSAGTELRRQEEAARLAALPARMARLRDEIAALHAARGTELQASDAAARAAEARVDEASAQADFTREHGRRLNAAADGGNVAEIDALRAAADLRRQLAGREALAADQRRLVQERATRGHQAQARIDQLMGMLAALEGEAATLRNTVARLQVEIDRHALRAPVAGVVADVQPLAAGSYLAEGQKVATVLPRGQLRVVAEFAPATAMGRIRVGQSAQLRLEGFAWAQYGTATATVARVAGELREQLLRVELTLQPPVAGLGGPALPLQHGLAGSVEVAIERVSPATLLLRAAGARLTGSAPPASTPTSAPAAVASTAPEASAWR
jgi:membrane fusion protein, adhesin transport system